MGAPDSLQRWSCTDDHWSAVLATVKLPAHADLDAARMEYDKAASEYLSLALLHRTRFADGSPAKVWREKCGHLEATLVGITIERQPIFWHEINKALHIAKAAVVACEMEGSIHQGRRNPARDGLYNSLLDILTRHLGGKLTTSRSSNKETGKRVAYSPAMRFLLVALAPILRDDMIGVDAIERIIRTEIVRRKRMPEMVESWMKVLNAMKKPTP